MLALDVIFPDAVNLPVETFPLVRFPVAVIVPLDEIDELATKELAVTVPEKLALVGPVILAGKSIVSDWVVEFSKVVIAPPLEPFKPKLKVLVVKVTQAILALTTTFPVGELTVIPCPGVLLTDKTAWS